MAHRTAPVECNQRNRVPTAITFRYDYGTCEICKEDFEGPGALEGVREGSRNPRAQSSTLTTLIGDFGCHATCRHARNCPALRAMSFNEVPSISKRG
ncbi:hypothetical protein Trydic_g19572 [Trypoxylus dichotomus]